MQTGATLEGRTARGDATVWSRRATAGLAALFAPVDLASLVFFRAAFGLIMFWEVWRYFDNDWIRIYYIDPGFLFTYPGLGWIRPWPGEAMYVHFLLIGALALCVMVGYRYRLCATLLFLAFTYVFLLDQTRYLNHFYLIALIAFAMIFIPAHKSLSFDVSHGRVQRSDDAPRWSLWLLQFLIGLPYFFGGVAKLNADWLRGEPMRMWLANRTDFPLIGRLFTEEWIVYGFSYGGLLLDLLAVPLLLWRPTRLYAYLAIVAFHLLNAKLFSIGIFPWFMIVATTLFFAPNWPRLGGELWPRRDTHEGTKSKKAKPNQRPARLTGQQQVIAAALGLFVAVQMLLPFRHHLYPGDVNWTEEGHRWAWHMKLRSKSADVVFHVRDPAGETWQIDPRDYLTSNQTRKMSTRPSMILEFAHFLAEDFARAGYVDVEVRAESWAGLNGRAYQPLIDPNVDLAVEQPTAGALSWIVPLETPLR